MGVISGIVQLFSDRGKFFDLCHQFFDCLPLVVKLLVYFSFGGVLILGILRLVAGRT